MKSWPYFVSPAVLFTFVAVTFAQESTQVDLLPLIDAKAHAALGKWQQVEPGLKVTSDGGRALCDIPYELRGPYQLRFDFTREEGDDLVGMILPLGKSQVLLELSGWSGYAHGLSRVNQSSTRKETNPTSVRPGKLKNGLVHRVAVNVEPSEKNISIVVELNGAKLIDWSGTFDEVEPNLVHRTQNNVQPAIATSKSTAVFHKLVVSHASGAGKPASVDLKSKPSSKSEPGTPATKTPTRPGKIDLTKIKWAAKTGDIEVVTFQDEEVVNISGNESVALLPDIELGDGTIEVDIASNTFSGIAFRAADAKNYDLLYFRPQNSGKTKHKYSVQYVCKGREDADWRTLREKFPGMYEAGAKLKVNEWFRARIFIEGTSVKAFVDDSPEPVLVVSEMLGNRASGRIGIWGWNTNFRNLSVQPTSQADN